jgi:hypothetical protein
MASGKTYSFRKGDRVGLYPTITHYDEEVSVSISVFD